MTIPNKRKLRFKDRDCAYNYIGYKERAMDSLIYSAIEKAGGISAYYGGNMCPYSCTRRLRETFMEALTEEECPNQ